MSINIIFGVARAHATFSLRSSLLIPIREFCNLTFSLIFLAVVSAYVLLCVCCTNPAATRLPSLASQPQLPQLLVNYCPHSRRCG